MSLTDNDMAGLGAYLRRRDERPLPAGSVDRIMRSVASRTSVSRRPRWAMALTAAALTGVSLAAVLVVSLWAAHTRGSSSAPQPHPTVGAPAPTTTATPTPTRTAQGGFPLRDVTWSSVDYGLTCGPGGAYQVRQVSYATPSPGTSQAIVLLNCAAGAGSPPAALLVFDAATSSFAPHLAQTLLTLQDDWVSSGHFSQPGGGISLPVTGYSSTAVPRCCPDIRVTLTWVWRGTAYVETSTEPSHERLPQ